MIEEVINGPFGFNCHMTEGCQPDGLWHEGVGYMFYGFGDSLWGLTSGYMGLVEAEPKGNKNTRGKGYWNLLNILEPNLPVADYSPRFQSRNFTDMGHAVLRSAPGPDQIYVLLDYGPMHSHAHPDKLNIVTYGCGRELSPDGIEGPYTGRSFRECTNLSMAHNTVVVDEQNQKPSSTRQCNFFEMTPRVKVVDALGTDSYDGVTLQRTIALTDAYIVDFFRVTSSQPHCYDWIHRNFGVLQVPPFVAPRPGPLGTGPGYHAVTELTSGVQDESWSIDWQVADECSVRLHMLGVEGTELITGRTLAGPEENLQAVFVRRRAKDTVYASVIEPYRATSAVAGITGGTIYENGRPAEPARAAAMVVSCASARKRGLPERRDCFLISYEGAEKRHGRVTLDGQMGIVLGADRREPECMFLIQGSKLACGGWAIEADQPATIYFAAPAVASAEAPSSVPGDSLVRNQGEFAVQIKLTGDFGPSPRVFRTNARGLPDGGIACKSEAGSLSFTIGPRSQVIIRGASQ